MLQSSLFQRSLLDGVSFSENRLNLAEVDIGRRQIVQTLVITPMVVIVHEGTDMCLQVARQRVVFPTSPLI